MVRKSTVKRLLITKLIKADRHAISRLHDEKGNFIGWSKAIRHGIPAFATGIMRLAFQRRPKKPWIAYDAINIFERTLTAQSRVLEFGSGMSTLWYAQRAGSVVAIEDWQPWFNKVMTLLSDNKLNNVDYRFRPERERYCALSEFDGKKFDLIVIDGSHRDACINAATQLIAPGGMIYLDNSDRSAAPSQEEMVGAETALRSFAQSLHTRVQEITDFAPTQLFVNQGLLVEVPS